jgi:hypothetical protein
MSLLQSPMRKNDNVLVIAGKDRGKRGRVLKVVPAKNRLVVEGVNMIKRHTKPNPARTSRAASWSARRRCTRQRSARVPGVRRADARRPQDSRRRPQGPDLPQVRGSSRQMTA